MDRIVLVSFGNGGTTAYLAPKAGYGVCTIQGYDSPECFVTNHAGRDCEGALVVDVREAVKTPAGYRWVFAGPLVNPALADGAVNACPEPDPTIEAALAAGGFAPALATRKMGGLDEVSPAEYVRGWKAHGAKTGQVRGGVIVWDAPAPVGSSPPFQRALNATKKEEPMARSKHSGGIDWSRPEHLNRTCPACAASQVGTTAELVENHSRSLRKQTRDAERGLPRTRTFAIRSYVTFRDEPERIDVWDVTAPNVETALRLEHRRLRRAFPLAKSWEVQWESPAGHSWTHHAEVRR